MDVNFSGYYFTQKVYTSMMTIRKIATKIISRENINPQKPFLRKALTIEKASAIMAVIVMNVIIRKCRNNLENNKNLSRGNFFFHKNRL